MLRPFLCYEPDTGHLYWRFRIAGTPYGGGVVSERAANIFNGAWAGKRADRSGHQNYRRVRLFYVAFHAHRVIWALHFGSWPDQSIDHINGDSGDNRLDNLRVVSHQENCMNRRHRVDNVSGRTGVQWHKRSQKWIARINIAGKDTCLGYFADKTDAIAARTAAESLHGYGPNHGSKT